MKTLILITLAMMACAVNQPKPQPEERPCAADLRWDENKYGECPKDGK